jgi:hypothetical protein
VLIARLLRPGTSAVDLLKRLWGLGISVVLTVAVIPYPLMALYSGSEDSHRLHDTVGAMQYLPLWALPVLLFTLGRDREGAWRLALATSLVMAGVGVWAGDLVPSLSWMPLATLLVLWPRDVRWHVMRPSVLGAAGAASAIWVAVTVAPNLVRLQRMHMPDPHSARFHFSGTAAAYLALATASAVVALWRVGTALHLTVAASLMLAGVANLVWPLQESSIDTSLALALLGAGAATAAAALLSARRYSSPGTPYDGASVGSSARVT